MGFRQDGSSSVSEIADLLHSTISSFNIATEDNECTRDEEFESETAQKLVLFLKCEMESLVPSRQWFLANKVVFELKKRLAASGSDDLENGPYMRILNQVMITFDQKLEAAASSEETKQTEEDFTLKASTKEDVLGSKSGKEANSDTLQALDDSNTSFLADAASNKNDKEQSGALTLHNNEHNDSACSEKNTTTERDTAIEASDNENTLETKRDKRRTSDASQTSEDNSKVSFSDGNDVSSNENENQQTAASNLNDNNNCDNDSPGPSNTSVLPEQQQQPVPQQIQNDQAAVYAGLIALLGDNQSVMMACQYQQHQIRNYIIQYHQQQKANFFQSKAGPNHHDMQQQRPLQNWVPQQQVMGFGFNSLPNPMMHLPIQGGPDMVQNNIAHPMQQTRQSDPSSVYGNHSEIENEANNIAAKNTAYTDSGNRENDTSQSHEVIFRTLARVEKWQTFNFAPGTVVEELTNHHYVENMICKNFQDEEHHLICPRWDIRHSRLTERRTILRTYGKSVLYSCSCNFSGLDNLEKTFCVEVVFDRRNVEETQTILRWNGVGHCKQKFFKFNIEEDPVDAHEFFCNRIDLLYQENPGIRMNEIFEIFKNEHDFDSKSDANIMLVTQLRAHYIRISKNQPQNPRKQARVSDPKLIAVSQSRNSVAGKHSAMKSKRVKVAANSNTSNANSSPRKRKKVAAKKTSTANSSSDSDLGPKEIKTEKRKKIHKPPQKSIFHKSLHEKTWKTFSCPPTSRSDLSNHSHVEEMICNVLRDSEPQLICPRWHIRHSRLSKKRTKFPGTAKRVLYACTCNYGGLENLDSSFLVELLWERKHGEEVQTTLRWNGVGHFQDEIFRFEDNRDRALEFFNYRTDVLFDDNPGIRMKEILAIYKKEHGFDATRNENGKLAYNLFLHYKHLRFKKPKQQEERERKKLLRLMESRDSDSDSG